MRQEQQQEEQAPLRLSTSALSPVEQQQQDPPESESLQRRARLRGRWRRRRRLRRAQEERALSQEWTFEQTLDVLEEETRKRKRRRTWVIVGLLSYIGLMLIMTLVMSIQDHKFHPQMLQFMGSMGGLISLAFAYSRTHRAAARKAAEYEDPRVVGHLANMLEVQDKDTRQVVEEALIGLLPKMRASDAGLLNAEQRESLYRGLRRKNPELVLAILKALEQIGDSRAIPYVEKLEKALQEQRAAAEAQGRSQEAAEIDNRILVAKECLQFLQDHAQQEQARQTLLRASDAARVAPDSLLRPATGKSDQESGSLLRASRPEEQTGG